MASPYSNPTIKINVKGAGGGHTMTVLAPANQNPYCLRLATKRFPIARLSAYTPEASKIGVDLNTPIRDLIRDFHRPGNV